MSEIDRQQADAMLFDRQSVNTFEWQDISVNRCPMIEVFASTALAARGRTMPRVSRADQKRAKA